VLEPLLAEHSAEAREWHRDLVDDILVLSRDYAFDEAPRQDTDAAVGYERYDDAVEQALRQDLLLGAQRLARDVRAAEGAGTIRKPVLADAFGVAQWAIGVPAGQQVPPARLAMLPDERLRFVVGAASVAAGGMTVAAW
jgi:hypothetical protein